MEPNSGPLTYLYYQRTDGYIYESRIEFISGWESETRVVKAKMGSPLSAIAFASWYPAGIRLYYLDDVDGEDRLMEHRRAGTKWASGGTLPTSSIALNTRIASCGWGDELSHTIIVYYQNADMTLSALEYSPSQQWQNGGSFVRGCSGSSMSVNRTNGSIRVYCQGEDDALLECVLTPETARNTRMFASLHPVPMARGTSISGVAWKDALTDQRVCFVDSLGNIQELCDSGLGWAIAAPLRYAANVPAPNGPRVPVPARVNQGARLASVLHCPDPTKISVFFKALTEDHFSVLEWYENEWHLEKLNF